MLKLNIQPSVLECFEMIEQLKVSVSTIATALAHTAL